MHTFYPRLLPDSCDSFRKEHQAKQKRHLIWLLHTPILAYPYSTYSILAPPSYRRLPNAGTILQSTYPEQTNA